jgi:hypothetical protein
MHFETRRTMLMATLALLTGASRSLAAGVCCAHCNCQSGCQKVCRLVREDKKVSITCWGCKCEDFCIGGPSKPGCKHCEEVCATCDQADKSGVCVQPKKFVWLDWIPGCANGIGTKKKLMKKTITKTVPSFKWVIEDCCQACEAKVAQVEIPAGSEVPPPPAIAGIKLVHGIPEAPLPPQ